MKKKIKTDMKRNFLPKTIILKKLIKLNTKLNKKNQELKIKIQSLKPIKALVFDLT